MINPRLLVSILLLLVVLPAPAEGEAAAKPEAETEALLQEAMTLWDKKKYNEAMAAFNEAVEADPDNLTARLRRGAFFEEVSGIVVEEDREQFRSFARSDYQFITKKDPNSIAAGLARDFQARMDGRVLFPERTVECPDDANQAYAAGRSHFNRAQYESAAKFYGVAASACPDSAVIWISYADCHYLKNENEKARNLFRRAVEADPWNRRAHRYLADAEARLGNLEAAFREAALAVVSDPTYEAAWSSMRTYAGAAERSFLRVYGEKTRVVSSIGEDGKEKVEIQVPAAEEPDDEGDEGAEGEPGEKEEVNLDSVAWVSYGMNKAVTLSGTIIEEDESGEAVERKIDPDELSAIEFERLATRFTLQVLTEVEGSDIPPETFWAMMARADERGFLDEAIFLHLMDEALVADYVEYREEHSDRLLRYLVEVVAPVAKEITPDSP